MRRLRHGMTAERYQELFVKQNGLCCICGNPETMIVKRTGQLLPLSVDHNHECCPGKKSCSKCFRGLICSSCNKGLGYFKDSILNLRNAIEYLQRNVQ